jgi:hypothetical protein
MSTNRPRALANINLGTETDRVLGAGRARLEALRCPETTLAILSRVAAVIDQFSRKGHQLAGSPPDPTSLTVVTATKGQQDRDSIADELWLTAAATFGILEQARRDNQQLLKDSPSSGSPGSSGSSGRKRREKEMLLFCADVAGLVEQFLKKLDECGLPPVEDIPPADFLPTAERPAVPPEPPEPPEPEAPVPPLPLLPSNPVPHPQLEDTLPDTQLLSPPAAPRPHESDKFDFVVPPEAWYDEDAKKSPPH